MKRKIEIIVAALIILIQTISAQTSENWEKSTVCGDAAGTGYGCGVDMYIAKPVLTNLYTDEAKSTRFYFENRCSYRVVVKYTMSGISLTYIHDNKTWDEKQVSYTFSIYVEPFTKTRKEFHFIQKQLNIQVECKTQQSNTGNSSTTQPNVTSMEFPGKSKEKQKSDEEIIAGDKAFEAGNLQQAKWHYQKAIQLYPDAQVAKSKLNKVEAKIEEKRQEELERQRPPIVIKTNSGNQSGNNGTKPSSPPARNNSDYRSYQNNVQEYQQKQRQENSDNVGTAIEEGFKSIGESIYKGTQKSGNDRYAPGPCYYCNGAGGKKCSSCYGKGSNDCSNCTGGSCSNCRGTGRFGYGSNSIPCGFCYSNGKCRYCNGQGSKQCTSCSGKGSQSCYICRGTGKQ